VARYVEKSKLHSHHQLEGDQGGLTGENMLDWCRSGEETGGKPYLDMECATESEVADTKGSTATLCLFLLCYFKAFWFLHLVVQSK
jgi:hypothetical protein